jgi:hypothetical protein
MCASFDLRPDLNMTFLGRVRDFVAAVLSISCMSFRSQLSADRCHCDGAIDDDDKTRGLPSSRSTEGYDNAQSSFPRDLPDENASFSLGPYTFFNANPELTEARRITMRVIVHTRENTCGPEQRSKADYVPTRRK